MKNKQCINGKHKFRENKFGITWCIICGLLSNCNAPKLETKK